MSLTIRPARITTPGAQTSISSRRSRLPRHEGREQATARFVPINIATRGLLWLHPCGRTQPYQEGASPQAGMCIGCLRFGRWRQLHVIDD